MFSFLACPWHARLASLSSSATCLAPPATRRSYLCYLAFQLHTHKELFQAGEEEGEPRMSLAGAIVGLSLITIIVAFNSE